MDLDSGLLQRDPAGEESSASRSGRLIESKRRLIDGKKTLIEEREAQSLREAVLMAKRKKGAEKEEEGAAKAPTNPIKKSTSKLLRQSWLNLVDSFGLTFIWINIHAFLHVVIGDKFFCKLGAEWSDALPLPAELKDSPSAQKGMKAAETVEKMGVGCIDLGCCAIIFLALVVISLIVSFISGNPLDIIKNIFQALWCYLGGC